MQISINRRQLSRAPHWITSTLAINGTHGWQLDFKVLHAARKVAVVAPGGIGHVYACAARGCFACSALVAVNGGDLLSGPD